MQWHTEYILINIAMKRFVIEKKSIGIQIERYDNFNATLLMMDKFLERKTINVHDILLISIIQKVTIFHFKNKSISKMSFIFR